MKIKILLGVLVTFFVLGYFAAFASLMWSKVSLSLILVLDVLLVIFAGAQSLDCDMYSNRCDEYKMWMERVADERDENARKVEQLTKDIEQLTEDLVQTEEARKCEARASVDNRDTIRRASLTLEEVLK